MRVRKNNIRFRNEGTIPYMALKQWNSSAVLWLRGVQF